MDSVIDFVASLVADHTDAILMMSVLVVVLLLALIGAHSVYEWLLPAKKSPQPGSRRSYRGLVALLLGGLAGSGPLLFRTLAASPEFVDGVDAVLDGYQARFRDWVVATASLKDDALLDKLDRLLDGFQSKLRHELATAMKEETARANDQTKKP